MTREEILNMGQQAGWEMPHTWDESDGFLQRLEQFAALVAAAKQEQLARQWDALHEQYMADPLRRQMMLSYEMVARMIRGGGNLTFGVRK